MPGMQWLSLVPEDSGTQRLKADSRRPAATRSVDAVCPGAPVHATRSGNVVRTPPRPVTDRRRGERRSGHERRSIQHAVLLDTRCGAPRRGSEDRRQSSGSRERIRSTYHINLYA
jgi:hypothetical protein